MPKIILRGYIQVPDKDLQNVKAELITHTRLTRAEPGCLVFEVKPVDGDPNRFSVYEEFVDQAAFDRHQARVKTSIWGEVSQAVERHYQITSEI